MYLKRIILIALIIALSVNVMCVSAISDTTFNVFKFDEDTLDEIQTKYGITIYESNFSASTTDVGLYPQTGRMSVRAPQYNDDGSLKKNVESYFKIKWASNQDVSQYSHINILIYSPSATGSKLEFAAYYEGSSAQKYNMDGGIIIDFQGWKLLSLPMSSFSGMDWSKMDRLRFATNVWNKAGESDYAWMQATYLNFDRIWFSKEQITLPKAQSFYPAEGNRVSPLKPRIKIAFNNNLSDVTRDMISLLKNGEEYFAAFDIETNENVINIVLDADLSANTEYSLKLSGIKDEFNQVIAEDLFYNFTTYAQTVAASEIAAKNSEDEEIDAFPESGSMKLSADVKNMGAEEVSPVIYAITYDQSGKQQEIYVGEMESSLQPGTQDDVSVEIPAEKIASAASIRTFVSEKKDVISMLGNRFRSFTSTFEPSDVLTKNKAGSEVSLETDEPKIENGTMALTGKINIPLGNVLIKLTDTNGVIKQIMPISADENGNFSSGFPMDFDSGWFNYTAQFDTVITQPKQIYYISDSESDNIRVRINDAQSSNAVEEILREYPYEFELDKHSEEEISDLAVYIYEKTDYSLYSEIKNRASLYRDITKKLRECMWSGLDKVLSDNADNIFSDKTDYEYYSGLDAAERARICEKLASCIPVKTVVEFRTDFHNGIEAYKNENLPPETDDNQDTTTDRTSTGGGGGGGGGGNKSYRVDMEIVQNTDLAEDKTSEEQAETDSKIEFCDMDTAAWAQEAVSSLAKAGIISASPDNKFRPHDAVSREEFVKMVVCVFELKTEGMKAIFTDTAENAWYISYIGAGVQDGIVRGFDDGSFGIGAPIIRQDMAVMLYRALSGRGYISLQKEEISFSDSDEISDYARQAVEELAQNSFIEGNDSGKFAPNSSLTRAEAAQVIYRVYNVMAKGVANVEQS